MLPHNWLPFPNSLVDFNSALSAYGNNVIFVQCWCANMNSWYRLLYSCSVVTCTIALSKFHSCLFWYMQIDLIQWLLLEILLVLPEFLKRVSSIVNLPSFPSATCTFHCISCFIGYFFFLSIGWLLLLHCWNHCIYNLLSRYWRGASTFLFW